MVPVTQLLDELTAADLERIQEMAAQNFAPSDICKALKKDKWTFMHLWRQEGSVIRKSYDLGRLQIEETKQAYLLEKVRNGETFAIQVHDKATATRNFENIKQQIFSLE